MSRIILGPHPKKPNAKKSLDGVIEVLKWNATVIEGVQVSAASMVINLTPGAQVSADDLQTLQDTYGLKAVLET